MVEAVKVQTIVDRKMTMILRLVTDAEQRNESIEVSYQTQDISSDDKQHSWYVFLSLFHIETFVYTGVIPTRSNYSYVSVKQKKELTIGSSAFRRKKALQDMQVITLKFIPRATSPQMRQIKHKRDLRSTSIVQ